MADTTLVIGKTRKDLHRALCQFVCIMAGIEPINERNGDAWIIFSADAERLMSDLEKRNFKFGTSE